MGTHPKGPSTLTLTGENLSEWISRNPVSLGQKIPEEFPSTDGQLPFLFKVLSVRKSLSIQAHPTKVRLVLLYTFFRST